MIFRALAIWTVATFGLFVYGVAWLALLMRPGAEQRAARRAHVKGVILRRSLSALGATFVKLGQVMSTRIDLFPMETIAELRKLQDALPPFSFREVERTVREELGRPVTELYAEFDQQPVAAASVAQVHRARLADGAEVAVKVLRPQVRETVEKDAAVLVTLAKAVALHPGLRLSDPVGHVEELIQGIRDQTDLRREQTNYARFGENFRDEPRLVFPKVYPELSSARVMTMEFIHGSKVDALPEGDHSDLANLLSHMFLEMIFNHGFLHVDLHPGNFVVQADGRVAVFDVGLVKELTPELLDEFVDWNRCLVMGTANDFVAHMKVYHTYVEGTVDWDALVVDLERFVSSFRGLSKEEIQVGELLDQAFALGRKYKVHPKVEFALIMVGVLTSEGVGKILDAKTDMLAEMSQYLLPLLMARATKGMLHAQAQ
ncbi:MAG: AarF/UbiB family protein [Polyangiales bacterium]